jgi:hypothetical protein
MLLSLAGATWAVIVARHTHPVALILLSAAIVAAGLVAVALHHAITSFFAPAGETPRVSSRSREFLEQEKSLVLRSIKELEFDRSMGKVSDKDFAEIAARLRARAIGVMEQLERLNGPGAPVQGPPSSRSGSDGPSSSRPRSDGPSSCPSCGMAVDADARFCKSCGTKL